ncbi:hypothetical protein AB1N83_009159 [Pleurotus pulmonarius]
MQFTTKLASFVALATMAIASPAVVADTKASLVTDAEFDNWLRTTDADLTFIGSAKEPLASRSALDTRVVYCDHRIGNICGDQTMQHFLIHRPGARRKTELPVELRSAGIERVATSSTPSSVSQKATLVVALRRIEGYAQRGALGRCKYRVRSYSVEIQVNVDT